MRARGNKKLNWLTTAIHPVPAMRAHTCREDAGVTGWRLHLVEAGRRVRVQQYGTEKGAPIDFSPALCGLTPKHGWGLDMFIDAPCKRCLAVAEKKGIDMPEIP